MQLWVQTMLLQPQPSQETHGCENGARASPKSMRTLATRTISIVKEQEINSFWRSPGFGDSQCPIHIEHRGDCRKQRHTKQTHSSLCSYTQNIFKRWKFNLTFPNQTKEEKSFSLCVDACTLQSLHIPGHIHTHTVTHPFPTVVACFATFCCVLIFTSLQFFFSFCECLCDATIVSWNESFECIACLISICADNWYKSVRAINKVLVDTIQVDAMKLIAGVVFFFDSCSKGDSIRKIKKLSFENCDATFLFCSLLAFLSVSAQTIS